MPLTVVEADILAVPGAAENGPERCYHCKRALFTRLTEAARADGFSLLIDGTNASDDAGDRPGMRALRELSVRSPLRECGLTKEEVRRLSREARSVHLGQARLRLPGYTHSDRNPDFPGNTRSRGTGGGRAFGARLFGFPRARIRRSRTDSAHRGADEPGVGAQRGDPPNPAPPVSRCPAGSGTAPALAVRRKRHGQQA